jgi:oligosaccharide repeat unit polymerase
MKKTLQNPLSISVIWWSVWGLLSCFSLTGLDIPTPKTYLILSLFLISLIVGGLLVKFKTVKSDIVNEQAIVKKYDFVFKICSWIMFVILTYLSVKATSLLMQKSSIYYKTQAFSTATYVGKLFDSKTLENIYFFLSSPILLYIGLYGLVDFWKNTRFKNLMIGFVLNGMDAYIRLARVNVYMLIVLFVLLLLFSEHEFIPLIKKKKKQFIVVFFAFLSLLAVGFSRGYSSEQQVKMFVVDYHTVGFSLFDSELKNPASVLNNTITYGRLFIGGLETCFTIVIRQFDKTYYSPALSTAIRLAENDVLIGKIRYNSYYTLLYTLYSDGRFIGVILGGLILGFSLNYYFKRWIKFQQTRDAFYVILIMSVLVMSIFISQLEIMRSWILLVGLIGVDLFTKKVKN